MVFRGFGGLETGKCKISQVMGRVGSVLESMF
jgi:hypothetical protein